MSVLPPLVDGFGRVHTNLRLSITDRCNIRCTYCMPAGSVKFQPREQLLTYEEIVRFVRIVTCMGITTVRITGGEPLVRAKVSRLVGMLSQIETLRDIALTTNGLLLAEQASALKAAGLRRLNISLDTLSEETFLRISRRSGLSNVLEGIAAAQQVGFDKIRLNALAMRRVTEPDILPLARFARERGLELRFIEFMPLDADDAWQSERVLSGATIRAVIESEFGCLEPIRDGDPSQPATDYAYRDGKGRVGFINPVTQPFCGDCNRLRLTSEGQVRNCLFSTNEVDARQLLRAGGSDEQIAELVRRCVADKKPGHGIDSPDFLRPRRAMYQIGG